MGIWSLGRHVARTRAASVGLHRMRGRRQHWSLVGLWTRGGEDVHQLGSRDGAGRDRRYLGCRRGSWESHRRRGNASGGRDRGDWWVVVAAVDIVAKNSDVVAESADVVDAAVGSVGAVAEGQGCMLSSAGRGLIGTQYAMRKLLPVLVKPMCPGEC